MRILIVEDEFISRSILLKIMKEYGDVDVAISEQEAISAFDQAYEDNNPYKLIFLDRKIPGGSGDTVLEHMRTYEDQLQFSQRSTIIMTTSMDEPAQIMGAFNKQCEGYVVKPIDKDKLLNTVRNCGIKL